MTEQEKREAARQFIQKWNGRGKEDEDDRSYWLDFIQKVLGYDNATDLIEFQKKVVGDDGNTKRIDAYIPSTRIIIEQKSLGIALDKPQAGHGGDTPFEQAKKYNHGLKFSEKARWIITSNFAEIWIYDMDQAKPEPFKLTLNELQTKYSLLEFMIQKEKDKITQEMEISVAAGNLVGKLYDAFLAQYKNPENEETLKSLNILCVRLVFCLYAEDANIFGKHLMFHDYLEKVSVDKMRKALIEFFEVLDTPEDKRDPYLEEDLAEFPYVNGGLFAQKDVEIPMFTEEIKELLLDKASAGFDWSMISPTIFGAVFESTLNPETRRSGGMHYTSIENIHKVIDPLFMNEFNEEYNKICDIQALKTRDKQLRAFQDKLASLNFLDPACGSGNFLTETYISLRRLENKIINELQRGQMTLGFENNNPIKINIEQFYGIEINDFAVTVAKTALWIAESQMMKETENVVHMTLNFLPLKTNANIVEGNALRLNWDDIVPIYKLSYIIGNPPFVGYSLQSSEQKNDIMDIYKDKDGHSYKFAGKIDYVSCWYYKAAKMIYNTNIRVAFVSTNSITQGEQVFSVWKPLYDLFNIQIDFAYRTFIWDSEASAKAHVHCVIIGFSFSNSKREKFIIQDTQIRTANNINAYLIDAPNIFIQSRSTPLCDIIPMTTGNRPADGGNLIIEADEYNDFIAKEPGATKYIKKLTGAGEYINNKKRYCLWLVGADISEIRKMPEIMKRIDACKKDRLSGAPDRQKLARTPMLFRETNNPDKYIIVPCTSSENRRYVPLGFLNGDVIPTNSATIIPNGDMYELGILTSNVHMSWMRAVCGRLKSDYRYSKDIVYNNFPWPTPTEEQKRKIEETAQGILDARALYPDCSLADLYDPLTMPIELQKAHTANDKAVMKAYGFDIKTMTEADCVAELMKMYQKLTTLEG